MTRTSYDLEYAYGREEVGGVESRSFTVHLNKQINKYPLEGLVSGTRSMEPCMKCMSRT